MSAQYDLFTTILPGIILIATGLFLFGIGHARTPSRNLLLKTAGTACIALGIGLYFFIGRG